ncbi:MAG TPA: hypothetical protein VMB49_11140 [Acidobacteriaceae bacterium]|nr:hypothetical protein [Acidobacteriaceae bacterium]
MIKKISIALALIAVPSAFAANKGSLHVSSQEDLAGQTLIPGDYTVQWEDHGPEVTLHVMRGKKVVAEATADIVPQQYASTYDSVVLQTVNGKRTLSLIFFSGKTFALRIQEPPATANLSSR